MRRARFSPTMPDKNNLFLRNALHRAQISSCETTDLCENLKQSVLLFLRSIVREFLYSVINFLSLCVLSLLLFDFNAALTAKRKSLPLRSFSGDTQSGSGASKSVAFAPQLERGLPSSCGSFQFARKPSPQFFGNSACITRIRRNSPTFLRSTGRLSREFRMQRSTTSFRQLPLSDVGKHKMRTALVSTSLTPFNAHEFCGELRLRSWRRSGITSPSNLLLACLY